MSTKNESRGNPEAKRASAKTQPAKTGTAKAPRLTVKTAARRTGAASPTPSTARARASTPSREATPAASESLLALTNANFAALRKQLQAGSGKRAHAAAAKDDKNFAEALNRLEAGYRELLRGS